MELLELVPIPGEGTMSAVRGRLCRVPSPAHSALPTYHYSLLFFWYLQMTIIYYYDESGLTPPRTNIARKGLCCEVTSCR